MARSFRELVVWQKSIEPTTLLYKLTRQFPHDEIYGLSSQLRRAGVSIASNITEGNWRATRGEYRNFLGIARGSTLQTQLVIAGNLGYGDRLEIAEAEHLADETSKMLWAISSKL